MEQNLINNNKFDSYNEDNPNLLPLSEEEFNKIQNKKWDEKCDYINNLIQFITTHKEIEVNYNLLSIYIKYFLNFPNLKVNSACLEFLISLTPILNTNESYKKLISEILPSIVEKFKEKKERLNDQINILLTIILKNTLDLTSFLIAIKNFINDKSIIYKNSIAEFIFINLRKTYYYDLERATNIIIEIFSTCIQDSNIELKNCSMSSLSLLRKRVGRKRFDSCEEKQKLSQELLYEIEQVMQNINYDIKYDEGKPELNDDNEEYEFEEIEEEVEEEFEDSLSKRDSYKKSFRKSNNKIDNENKNINDDSNNKDKENKNLNSEFNNNKNEITLNKESINLEIENNNNINSLQNNFTLSNSLDNNNIINKDSKDNLIQLNHEESEINNNNVEIQKIKNNETNNGNENNKSFNKLKEKENSFKKENSFEKTKTMKENQLDIEGNEILINNETLLKEDLIQTLKNTTEEQPLELSPKITENTIENSILNTKQNNDFSLNEFEKKLTEALKNEEIKQLNQIPKPEVVLSPINKNKTQDEIEITEKIQNFINDKELFQLFSSNKWDEKKKAFIKLNKILSENINSYSNENKEIIFNFIRIKLNYFKETNFNILKEAYSCYITLFSSSFDKKYIDILIKGVYEKISDTKLKESITKLLLILIEKYGIKIIINELLNLFDKKAKIVIMKEYCIFFDKIIDDYGSDNLDIKVLIDFCVNLANNSNPQVRMAASQLICTLYKYIGNDIKILIKGIKESTLKNIEQEMEKIEVIDIKDNKEKKNTKKDNENINNENIYNSFNKDLIPRVDISKYITNKLIKDIDNGKWVDKKEGIENIQKIISKANNKILINGLKNLFNLIKTKLGDGNKNLVRLIVQLLSQLIEAIGNPIKLYSKTLLLSLLSNLADKQLSLREDCQICIEKWINECGFESIAIYIPQLLKTENFELRSELIQILKKNNDKITKDFPDSFFKEIMNSYLLCLQDKSSLIRTSVEELIRQSLKFINYNLYYKEIKEFKPAIADSLNLIMDKILNEREIEINIDENNPNVLLSPNITSTRLNLKTSINNIIYNNSNKIIAKKLSSKLSSKLSNTFKNEKKISLRENASKSPPKNTSISMIMNKSQNDDSNGNIKKISNIKSNSRTNSNLRLETSSTILKKKLENKSTSKKNLGSSSVIIKSKRELSNESTKSLSNKKIFLSNYKPHKGAKEKRMELDKKNNFCLENLIFDYVPKLKEQFKYIFNQEQISKMFSDDIKDINKSLDRIKKALIDNNTQYKVTENLDLILKFCGWKLMQNQTPSLIKTFYELSEAIFKVYELNNYIFENTESNILLNIFCERLTSPNNNFKDNASFYISIISNNIGMKKAFIQLLYICIPKNVKLKIEIIEKMNIIYSLGEIDDNYLSKAAKGIIKIYIEGDKNVRNKILPLIKEIFKVISDDIWRYTGDLSEKERDDLYELLSDEYELDNDSNEFNDDIEFEKNENDISNFKNDVSAISNINNSSYLSNRSKLIYEKIDIKDKKEFCSPNKKLNNNNKKDFISPIKIKDFKNEIITSKNSNSNKETPEKNNEQNLFILNNKTNQYEILSFETLKNSLLSLAMPTSDSIINIIITVHEIIFRNFEMNKNILIKNSDFIFISFINSINNCFKLKPLPVKTIKYITNVLCKLSGIYELISKISFDTHKKLIYLVLSSVLYDNLNTLGEKNEGMVIWKTFNSIMLKIIEYCNQTDTIIIFITEEKNNRITNQKYAEYSVRCLVKITQNIKDVYKKLDVAKILKNIHEILINFNQSDLETKSETDQMIIISIRNLLNELIRAKKEEIILDYNKGVENHHIKDNYIKRWIKNELDEIHKNLIKSHSNSNIRNMPIRVNQSPSINDIDENEKKKRDIEEMVKNKLKEKKIQIDNLNKSPSPSRRDNIQIITSPDFKKNEKLKDKFNNYNSINNNQYKNDTINNNNYNYYANNNNNDNITNKQKNFNQIQKKWKDVLSKSKNGRKKEDN